MDKVIHREAPPVPRRSWLVLGLWMLLLLFLIGLGAHIAYLIIGAFILFKQVFLIMEMKKCEYVMEFDTFKAFLGEKLAVQIPLDTIKEVHRGTFTQILRLPSIKSMASKNVTAIPKLAGETHLVVLIYEEMEQTKGLVLKPSLAFSLALEEMVKERMARGNDLH